MKIRLWLAGVPLLVGIALSIITTGVVWIALGCMIAYVGWQKGEELFSGATRVIETVREPRRIEPLTARMILPPIEKEAVEPAPKLLEPVKVKTNEGRTVFKPGMDFAIGVTDTGEEITMPKLRSVWVAGVGGMGKTVDMVSLAMQAVIKYSGEVRFVIIDPHMSAGPDALASRMAPLSPFLLREADFPNPVSGGAPVIVWINWLKDLAVKRKAGLDASMRIIIMVDEFTSLLDDEELSEPLNKLLMHINEEARKINMFAIVASQQVKSSRIKGTELRNTVGTFMLHNMPPALARQVVPEEFAAQSNRLKVGQAIYSSAGEQAIVRVVNRSSAEITERVTPYLPMEYMQPKEEDFPLELRESVIETHEMFLELGYDPEKAISVVALDAFGTGDKARAIRNVTRILTEGLGDE
jgi:hypothetical protein